MTESYLHHGLLHSIIEHGNFLNMEISQGSIAVRLSCGGIFNNDFIAIFLSLSVKKNMKIG